MKRIINLGTEESPYTVQKTLPRILSDILKYDHYECVNSSVIKKKEVNMYVMETEYHIINIKIVDFGRYIGELELKNCERPDIVIFGDNFSHIIHAIEITKTTFEESGNNAQYQRFSKFSSFPDHIKKSIIFTGKDTTKYMNKKNNTKSLRMYKTCKIKLYHISQIIQNFFNTIEPFSNIEDITEESTKLIKKLGKKMNVIINGSIVHINNLIVYKSINNGSHDPNIGKLIGILFCASVLCQNNENIREVQITDCLRTSEMSKKNKLSLSILHISSLLLGKCRFRIINTEHFVKKIKDSIVSDLYILPNILSTIHSRICHSEKLVSIHEESLNRDNIVFTNHASSELSKFKTMDWKKGLTPDLIIEHEDNYEIIEAETLKNVKNGIKQINSWITPENIIKWRTLYFKDKILHINIILYSPEPLMSYNFTRTQDNVKYILDSNNNKIVNLNYKPIIK
jgi:hypothetical protein